MSAYSDFTIPALGPHVTIYLLGSTSQSVSYRVFSCQDENGGRAHFNQVMEASNILFEGKEEVPLPGHDS
jgi:hypothetical protein